IILMSGHEASDISGAYEHGAVDFLTKPFTAEIVRAKVAVFVDLAKRAEELKAQEAALHLRQREVEKHWFLDTLESISDGFVALDPEWRFTQLNALAEKLLGRSRRELLHKSLWEQFPTLEGTPFGQAI